MVRELVCAAIQLSIAELRFPDDGRMKFDRESVGCERGLGFKKLDHRRVLRIIDPSLVRVVDQGMAFGVGQKCQPRYLLLGVLDDTFEQRFEVPDHADDGRRINKSLLYSKLSFRPSLVSIA